MVYRSNFRRFRKRVSKRPVRSSTRKIQKFKAKKLSVNTVRRIAKKVVSAQAENKTVQFFTTNQRIYPSGSASFGSSIFPVSPYTGYLEIPQGVGQGNRIGNKIKVKSIRFKGTLWPRPYDPTDNPNPVPCQIVFWFFINRSTPNATPTSVTGFLQDGDSSRNLSGQLSDLMSRVNNDQYKFLGRRIFKIGYSAYEGTGIQPAFQAYNNNDFKLNQKFNIDITKMAIKNCIYNDDVSNSPRSRGVFCMAQAIAADGSILPNNTSPVNMAYELTCSYEDL